MRGLTRLAVAELKPEPPCSHALDALFAGLPALESVTLHFRQVDDVRLQEAQPFPMALLRCDTCQYDWAMSLRHIIDQHIRCLALLCR